MEARLATTSGKITFSINLLASAAILIYGVLSLILAGNFALLSLQAKDLLLYTLDIYLSSTATFIYLFISGTFYTVSSFGLRKMKKWGLYCLTLAVVLDPVILVLSHLIDNNYPNSFGFFYYGTAPYAILMIPKIVTVVYFWIIWWVFKKRSAPISQPTPNRYY